MHIFISGANGFIGKGLCKRLIEAGSLAGQKITRLTLLDIKFDELLEASFPIRCISSDVSREARLDLLETTGNIDCIFHLASIPGGSAEKNYSLARKVNLDITQSLLEVGRIQVEAGHQAPKFIFASTIAVFGRLTSEVNDQTLPKPNTTYGAQKLIGEILVEDFSRRGWVDGYSLRLPGVLARPAQFTGQLSAFLSNILHEVSRGKKFVCPTSEFATTWASSLPCTIDNLLHGACFTGQAVSQRTITLPTSHFSMGSLADAIGEVFNVQARECITWEKDDRIEELFGAFPPLDARSAWSAGFVDDGDLANLVRKSLGSFVA